MQQAVSDGIRDGRRHGVFRHGQVARRLVTDEQGDPWISWRKSFVFVSFARSMEILWRISGWSMTWSLESIIVLPFGYDEVHDHADDGGDEQRGNVQGKTADPNGESYFRLFGSLRKK